MTYYDITKAIYKAKRELDSLSKQLRYRHKGGEATVSQLQQQYLAVKMSLHILEREAESFPQASIV